MPPKEIVINIILSFVNVCLTVGVGWFFKSMVDRSKQRDKEEAEQEEKRRIEHQALKSGVQAILRTMIINAELDSTTKGNITAEEKTNIEMMYRAYHDLGGNGVATAAYKHIIDMPLAGDGHV